VITEKELKERKKEADESDTKKKTKGKGEGSYLKKSGGQRPQSGKTAVVTRSPSPTQRSSRPTAHPQVTSSLDRLSFARNTSAMFGIKNNQWFSLFKRGVELLADMSTFQFTARGAVLEKRQQSPKQLQSGNVKGKIPYTRSILVKKAKTAIFKGQGVPQQLGKVSHSNWAWRPTEKGRNDPGKGANISQLGAYMAKTFFPCRCQQSRSQAMAASEWLRSAQSWQGYPWYESILDYFQSCRQQHPILSTSAATFAMVAPKHQGPQHRKVNNTWCGTLSQLAQQPFNVSLCEKSRGNKHGMGNPSRIFAGGCYKGSGLAPSKTFNPLVYHKKGGKTQVDHKLQGNQPFFGAKAIQARKLAGNFSLPEKRDVGGKNRFEARLFSFANCRKPKALHVHPGGTKSFPISGSMLWSKPIATTMAKCDESVPKKV
jgi:hypothetical protein